MRKSILLIEDNREMRENISEILGLANYEVFVENNGFDGVKRAKLSSPDLIICDIMMPKMNGYETLYLLGKDVNTCNIPFIFLTAKAEKSDWRKGMNMGADDYLIKPFEEMDLLNAVESRLKRCDMLKESFLEKPSGFNDFVDSVKSIDALKSLSLNKKHKIYKRKEILFHEGDYASSVFYIVKGKVKSYKENSEGKEYTTALYGEGDFLGYMSLIQNTELQDSAVALENSTVCRIHKDDFSKLLYNNQEVASAFVKMLAGDLLEKEQELINLAYNSVRKRVADGLLLLENKYNKNTEEMFSITIPRDALASIVGTSTESVIRVLSDLKFEKLVHIKGSKVTIIDRAKLSAIR